MVLTDKDKRVIRAFVKGNELKSNKLESTGNSLHGSWMGGQGIAKKSNGQLIVRVSSKKDEQVVNYLKKLKVRYKYR